MPGWCEERRRPSTPATTVARSTCSTKRSKSNPERRCCWRPRRCWPRPRGAPRGGRPRPHAAAGPEGGLALTAAAVVVASRVAAAVRKTAHGPALRSAALRRRGRWPARHGLAAYELALIESEIGHELEAARDLAREALEIAPKELRHYPLAALGSIALKLGRYREAMQYLEQAAQSGFEPPQLRQLALAHLGADHASLTDAVRGDTGERPIPASTTSCSATSASWVGCRPTSPAITGPGEAPRAARRSRSCAGARPSFTPCDRTPRTPRSSRTA